MCFFHYSIMGTETLETKCQKAIIQIANDVREINQKLDHIIQTYHDYFFRKPDYYYHHDY